MVPFGRQLIAIDLPGAGGSSAVMPPMRMRGLVKLAVACSTSWASTRSTSSASRSAEPSPRSSPTDAPERTRRLVLGATSPGCSWVPAKPGVLVHLATPLRYWRSGYAKRIIGDIYGGRSRHRPLGHTAAASPLRATTDGLGYLGQLWAGSAGASLPWLSRLAVPTLVMTGDDDPIIPTVNGRLLAHLIPGARLHIVPGGGHLFLLEEAASSAAVIVEFLR